jgi:L-fucose mutarotase
MLKGIDPLLSPELLQVMAQMGHGDEIVLADANFTAVSLAAGKPLLRLPGTGMRRACGAVLSLLPLDAMVAQPVAYMQVGGTQAPYRSALQRQVIEELASVGHLQPQQCEPIERFAFYERVRGAFAIVVTGELQPYANFIFKKGVIGEPLAA